MFCISRVTAMCVLIALLSCSKTARSDDAEGSEPAATGAAETDPDEIAEPVAGQAGVAQAPEPLRVDDSVTGEKAPELEAGLAQTAKEGSITVVSSTGKTEVIELGRSKLADAAEYTVTVEVPDNATAGATSTVKLVVTPKGGWKLNQDYPTKLTVTPPAGVTVAKPSQKREDAVKFSEKVGAFAIDFSPASAGKKKFAAKLRFAVCTESTCDPRTANLAWAVIVK